MGVRDKYFRIVLLKWFKGHRLKIKNQIEGYKGF